MKSVVSVDNMRQSDRYTIENITPSLKLMYRAGCGIVNSVEWRGKILIVAGKGNNAGDGYVVALILKGRGYDVEILLLDKAFSHDGEFYFERCQKENIPYRVYENEDLCGYDIIVDCIFGTGFSGSVTGKAKEVIQKINESGAYVVSADINSGLNGDSGLCELCVKSDLTVSIGDFKSGHFLGMAKDVIGKAVNTSIGIELCSEPYYLVEKDDVKNILGKRDNFSHKGTYGYVALIGGSLEYSGAIKLSAIANGALRSGCGVAKILAPRSICHSILPYILESTLYPLDEENGSIKFNKAQLGEGLKGISAIAIGMGMGQRGDNCEILNHILENYSVPLIIDADGLNTLAKMGMDKVKKSACSVILTPHLKELERLSRTPISEIEKNPVEFAKNFARENNVILLLKGPCTVITDGERVFLSNTGCAGMACGGSGDVLSGILLSLCAKSKDLTLSVSAGSYINGYAGEIAQSKSCAISMTAGDTARAVAEAITEIIK